MGEVTTWGRELQRDIHVSLWPYRVGVRLFKTFIRKSNIRDGDERRTRLEGGRTDRNGDNYRYTHA